MSLKGHSVVAYAAVALAATVAPSTSFAQPDARLLRPNIMVLLDTSGSMEFRMNARDDDTACDRSDGGECVRCTSGASQCSTSCSASESRNRWITAIEVLTGTINGYSCTQAPRSDATQYDYLYHLPHHQPLSGGWPLHDARSSQMLDGIIDVYADRVRFGLMTGDFYEDPDTEMRGMYSYADDRRFRPVGCLTAEIWNFGAKRAPRSATDIVPGGLVSVGPAGADTATLALINRQVQEALTGRPASGGAPAVPGVRPIGTTPLGALLDDALYYWTRNTDVVDGSLTPGGDPYFQCRNRANILITDGAPTDDLWRSQCRSGGECPYAPPTDTAMTMAMTGPSSPGVRTYVLAFDQNASVESALLPIALAGNTPRVYYANDRVTFATQLSSILDSVASASSTRVPPVFGTAGTPTAVGATQYQYSAGFNLTPGLPWSGSLVRQRTVCESPTMGAPPVPTDKPVDLSQGDDFGYNLQAAQRALRPGVGPRYLWTFVPNGATTPSALTGNIANADTTMVGFARALTDLTSIPSLFSYSTSTEVSTLLAWLRGDAGTVRQFRPLGDIYRSTPVNVPAPLLDLPDQSFSAYRGLPLTRAGASSALNAVPTLRRTDVRVGSREPIIYVGTNDGVLHAFDSDTGDEVWGFVPPYLVPTLRNRFPSTRAFGVDGTPVVKEVVYERSAIAPAVASSWRTVLVVGLRNGGPAFVGLDVTDPYQPKFLWQFTDPDILTATGTPAIGTLFYTPPSAVQPVERAVAFIPGGVGRPQSTCSPTSAQRPPRNSIIAAPDGGRGARRPYTKCWDNGVGQYLYVVDLQTGMLIRKLGAGLAGFTPTPTGSPLTGAPALYSGTSGTVTTRAYVGDADGTLWRADFSSRDPGQWWMSDEFDLYWGGAYNVGQPIIERPVLTVGTRGELNIAFGSGDPELLDDTTNEYRVAAFTETTTADSGGIITSVGVRENWEVRPGADTSRDFYAGERLTGALTLFNGVLYFGTFSPRSSMAACDFGFARLWGVDMTRFDVGSGYDYPRARLDLDGDPATTSDIVRVTADLNFNGSPTDDNNTVLFGVTIARRLSCNVTASAPDPLTGVPRSYVASSTGGEYRIVLQTAQSGRGGGAGLNPVVSRALPRPQMPARVDSWAAIFE
jgi:type IV pilus assembly protein PilY1